MADGTIRIRWLAPLPVVAAPEVAGAEVAGAEELVAPVGPERLPGQHPLAEHLRAHQPVAAVEVVEAAEQPQRPRHRRIFSAPSRICFMSPI